MSDKAPLYVHVGVPKTGTTFLQRGFQANRPELRDNGFLYPGPRVDHFFPALDLMGRQFHGQPDPRTDGAWERLVARLSEWHTRGARPAMISHEILSTATDDDIARLVRDLDFADAHLVLTLRDPARQLVAVWQENVKNRAVADFATFFRRTVRNADNPSEATTGYWPYQDVPGILARWSQYVPPERTHVATAPNPSGSGDLWDRFLRTLALDPETYRPNVDAANTSLGVAETALLIRLNKRVKQTLDWPTYERKVKFLLANDVLGPRAGRVPISLTEDEHAWAAAQADLMIAAVDEHVGDVQGDRDDLRPAPWQPASESLSRDDPPAEAVLEASVDALAGLLAVPDPADTSPPASVPFAARVRNRLRRGG